MTEMTTTLILVVCAIISAHFLFLAGCGWANWKFRSFVGFGIVGLFAISLLVSASVEHGRMLSLADVCVAKTLSESSKEEGMVQAEKLFFSKVNASTAAIDEAKAICVERIRAQQDAG